MKKSNMNVLIPALAVIAMTLASATAPAHAAADRTCAVYVVLINKTLIHRLRLSTAQRDTIKALRLQGLETMKEGAACRLPLTKALKMLGVAAPNLGQRSKKRRVHRLGS